MEDLFFFDEAKKHLPDVLLMLSMLFKPSIQVAHTFSLVGHLGFDTMLVSGRGGSKKVFPGVFLMHDVRRN